MTGTLAGVLDGYLDLRVQIDPVEGTFVGRHDVDGVLPAYDEPSVHAQVAALRSYTLALEEASAESLDDEIDRTAALHDARHLLLVLEREKPFTRDPSVHLAQVLGGLHLLMVRNAQDPPRRAAALLARLCALPDFLRTAEAVLVNPAQPMVALAASMLPGGIALVREGLDDPDVDLSSLDPAELGDARAAAVDALLAFEAVLARLADQAEASFAIGRDLFDRKLHTAHLIRDGADELLRYGTRLRAEALAAVEETAAEVQPGADWRDVATRLRAEMPPAGAALDAYERAVDDARRFTASHGLMRVTTTAVRVVPTPVFLRALVPFVAYQGPGAFDRDQDGTLFVTLPDDGASWRTTCVAELPSMALHEAVPGHHQQIVTANGLERTVRRVLGTPAAREGWALYCETLMAEHGFLASAAERFFHAYHLLWRALRIVLDVSLHTKRMSTAAAAAMLQDGLGLEQGAAAAEVARCCARPTEPLCYAVGRRDVLQLRDDARRARGGAFTLAAFHDELLQYGALPTALARWGMGLA